jgi:group I intron endonuclease
MKIYKITNTITNKIYVGQTSLSVEDRFAQHLKNAKRKVNRRLYDSINYHGVDNFVIEVIEDKVALSDVDDRERYWIKTLNTVMPNGYNMTDGGGGGNTLRCWSEEERRVLYKKQGDSRRGERPQEWRDSLSTAAILRESNKTEQEKDRINKKISTTLLKRYDSGEIVAVMPTPKYGKDNWNYVEVDMNEACNLIKLQWTLKDIASKYKIKPSTLSAKMKKETGKSFIEWRRYHGIKGAFGQIKRLDPD